jgi:hypothetical protein
MSTMPLVEELSSPRALVLCDGDLSSDDRDVVALLDFFGIAWELAPINQIAASGPCSDALDRSNFRILTSAVVLAKALLEERPDLLGLLSRAGSVYVHAFTDTYSGRNLLSVLTGDTSANIRPLCSKPTIMSVTRDLPGMCGAMSGLSVPVMPTKTDQVFDLHGQRDIHHIISTHDGDTFVRVLFQGVPFYLNASRKTIAVHSPTREFFDVKKFFASAVPITMYLRWAFAEVCWKGSETTACLIVDDPLLRPQHGFLDFRRALELMDEHNFTMSLAFIPWNWRRTHPDVVKLFQQRSDRFSLSIHGCDHIAGEFATRSLAELNARTKIASQRMESLCERTSLQHDRIMIFPQGAFSAESGRVLKLNGFVAAVNTEVAPSADSPNETEIADLWQVAITKYGTFPLFTRRYCVHGIENFAFDALLGKPCLIVAHHDEFKADSRNLIECIDRLNSLQGNLFWRSLGDAISRSFRVHTGPNGTRMLQMYGNRAHVENPSDEPRTIEFIKEEDDPDLLRAVIVNQQTAAWSFQGRFLRVSVTIPSRGCAELQTVYIDSLGQGSYPKDIRYKLKTGLRRYLCEARDNYVAKSEFLSSRLTARN